MSSFKADYNKKYGFKTGTSHSLKDISKTTGFKMRGLKIIFDKGVGAFYTNPASVRASVKSPQQWAYGRIYSAVMGGPASIIDAKHLIK